MSGFNLYGKMLAFSRLKLTSTNFEDIKTSLDELQPSNTTVPVVIESEEPLELTPLIELLWQHNVSVIGVIDGVLNEQAKTHKLAIFPNDGKRMERLEPKSTPQAHRPDSVAIKPNKDVMVNEATETQDNDTNHAHAETLNIKATPQKNPPNTNILVYEQILRSGQTLSHFGGDLIITATVNNGAEAITDGNLHIYGAANGRLVAGATGDQTARIFCQKFDPKLVSVAGSYCLRDDMPEEMIGKAVQVSYDSTEGLIFSLIKG